MARIPTEQNLPRVGPQGANLSPATIKRTDLHGREAGVAAFRFGDVVSRAATAMREERFKEEKQAALTDMATNYLIAQQDALEQAKQSATPGGKDFFINYANDLKSRNKAYVENLKARYDLRDKDLDDLRNRLDRSSVAFLSQASAFERSERKSFYLNETETSFEQVKLAVQSGKLDPDVARSQANTILENSRGILSGSDRRKLRKVMMRQIGLAELERRIQADPAGTRKLLSGGGLATKLVGEGVRASDIARAKKAADVEIRKRTAKARSALFSQRDLEFRRAKDDLVTGRHDFATIEERIGNLAKEGIVFTKSQIRQLHTTDEKATEKRAKNRKLLDEGERLVASGSIDPQNSDHRKAVDLDFAASFDGMAAAYRAVDGRDPTDDEKTAFARSYIKRANYIPKAYLGTLTGGLRSTKPGVAVKAAQEIAGLVRHNGQLAGQFSQREVSYAGLVALNKLTGMSDEDAVEKARQAIFGANDAEVKFRKDTLSRNRKTFTDDNTKHVDSGFGADAPGALRAQFQRLFEQHYLDSGDEKHAREQATIQLKRAWGRSRFNGGRFMFMPPDVAYRRSKDDNTEWQVAQLKADLSGLGIRPKISDRRPQISGQSIAVADTRDDSNIRLVLAPGGARMRDRAGNPTPHYHVLVKGKDGVWRPVTKKGAKEPLLWRPDYSKSDEFEAAKKSYQRFMRDAKSKMQKEIERRAGAIDEGRSRARTRELEKRGLLDDRGITIPGTRPMRAE